jgi:hypothetical protein
MVKASSKLNFPTSMASEEGKKILQAKAKQHQQRKSSSFHEEKLLIELFKQN